MGTGDLLPEVNEKSKVKTFSQEARNSKGYTVFDQLHGDIYARFIYQYIAVANNRHWLNKFLNPILSALQGIQSIIVGNKNRNAEPESGNLVSNTYHGKVVRLTSAKKLISIQQDVNLENLESIIPYPKARDIILHHPDHIAVLDCPCRVSRENPCLPLDVCLVVGEPFASVILEHHPDHSRKISQDEALKILEEEDARGHVHHAFFKDAMLGRFYAICNCCSCCCGAIQAHDNGTPMLASSGYIASIDKDLCIDCGSCVDYCQFHAIFIEGGTTFINSEKCMGCGVCVGKCSLSAISLDADPSRGIPLEIDVLLHEAATSRGSPAG